MSNIIERRPHLYLSRVGAELDFQLAVAAKLPQGDLLNPIPTSIASNGEKVLIVVFDIREGGTGGFQRTAPTDLSAAVVGNNETLHVRLEKNGTVVGEQGMLFADADPAGRFVSTDTLPFLRLVSLGNNRFRPSLIILPEGWTLNEQKNTETTAFSTVEYDVTLNGANGRMLAMEDLTLNRVDFTDSSDAQISIGGATVEQNGNNPRRKAKITRRTATMP